MTRSTPWGLYGAERERGEKQRGARGLRNETQTLWQGRHVTVPTLVWVQAGWSGGHQVQQTEGRARLPVKGATLTKSGWEAGREGAWGHLLGYPAEVRGRRARQGCTRPRGPQISVPSAGRASGQPLPNPHASALVVACRGPQGHRLPTKPRK